MSELFLKIINMSISAGWLILAVLVLRLVLKKAPRWVSVLLWGLVAVRLICPFSIESKLSLIPSAETISPEIMMAPIPSIHTGVRVINSVINPVLGSSLAPAPGASANPLQIWIPVLTVIWMLGTAALLLYTAVSYWRLRRRVDTATVYQDNIYQSENVSSPFVLGLVRPRIYLPFQMDSQTLEQVVAHEQSHIRRKDHWWKPLGFLLLTFHWFNPLMWLAYVLLCRDIELACDEKVIQALGGEQRADYAQALVTCSVSRPRIDACPLAFGEVGVKERVKSVMNYKKPAFWMIVLAVIICTGVAVCFLTNPREDSFSLHITVPAGTQDEFIFSEEEISPLGNRITVASGEGLGDTQVELKPVEVHQENAYDEAYYLTPGMPVKIDAEKGGWFRIGIRAQNPTEEDIDVYLDVSGVEVRIASKVSAVRKWFDYFDAPGDEMPWNGRLETSIPEIPDTVFYWVPEMMAAVTGKEATPLYYGMPIWSTYFCDLTGDGIPELCSSCSFGSGIVDQRIIIYDYANGASYGLIGRGVFDFTLRFDEAADCLYVDKSDYFTGEILDSGRLVFKNDCLQIEGGSSASEEPAE